MEAQRCKQCQQKSSSLALDEKFCWLQRHRSSRHDQPHTRAERGCKKKKPKQVPGCLSFPCSLRFTKKHSTQIWRDISSEAVRNVECKACRQAHRSGRISQQIFQSQWHLQSSPIPSTLSCVILLKACWAVYSSALLVWPLLLSKSTAYSQALCKTRFNTNPSHF